MESIKYKTPLYNSVVCYTTLYDDGTSRRGDTLKGTVCHLTVALCRAEKTPVTCQQAALTPMTILTTPKTCLTGCSAHRRNAHWPSASAHHRRVHCQCKCGSTRRSTCRRSASAHHHNVHWHSAPFWVATMYDGLTGSGSFVVAARVAGM